MCVCVFVCLCVCVYVCVCVYRVETPGLYRLVAWSYRGDFESLNEVQGGKEGPFYFPPIRYDDLVGEFAWINLDLTQEEDGFHEPTKPTVPSTRTKLNLKTRQGDGFKSGTDVGPIKTCTQGNEAGRWVHKGGDEPVWKKQAIKYKARPRGTGRKWLVDLREYEWRPYDCKVPVVEGGDIAKCLNKREVQFRGDSHTRVMMSHFQKNVCGLHFTRHRVLKISILVTLLSKYTWALTFENLSCLVWCVCVCVCVCACVCVCCVCVCLCVFVCVCVCVCVWSCPRPALLQGCACVHRPRGGGAGGAGMQD
jgi:hypothetical protein